MDEEELPPAPRQETAGGAHPGREEGDSALEATSEATDPGEEPPLEEGDGLLREWSEQYAKSSHWGELWAQTQVNGGPWTTVVRLHHGWMILGGRICLPEGKVTEVLVEQHRVMGHTGVRKLVVEAKKRFAWPAGVRVEEVAQAVRRRCFTCQACEPPNWNTRAPLSATPIPPHMTSVALDIFSLPRVEWRGKVFDAMLLCVDRQSGWVLARPTTKLGLTAEKAAKLVMDDRWDLLGFRQ